MLFAESSCLLFSTINRYVLRQILTPLLAALVISLLMLLAGRMLGFLDVTLGKRNSFTAVFKMLAYLTPNYLGLALPAALFLGIMFSFNRMSKAHEIDALKASGYGLHQILKPVMGLALVMTLLNLAAVGWLQPYGRYAYRSVLFTLTNTDAFDLAREGIFMKSGNRTFIVDSLNQSANSFKGLFIYDDRQAAGSEAMTSLAGRLINTTRDAAPILRLEHGTRLKVAAPPDLANGPEIPPFTEATFDSADFPLDRLSASIFRPRGADERELVLPELFTGLLSPPQDVTVDQMNAELHNRILKILALPMLALLAIPFALSDARQQDAYRFGIAIVLLLTFNVILEQGNLLTRINGVSPWISMWAPFLAYLALAVWQFRKAWLGLYSGKSNVVAEGFTLISRKFRQSFNGS